MGRGTRVRRWLKRIVVAALVLVLLVVLIGLWRVSRGPVSLELVRGRVEAALTARAEPFAITVGELNLTWRGRNAPPELTASQLMVVDADGRERAVFETVGLGLSLPRLLRAELAPAWIELRGLQSTLVREEDGSIDWGEAVESGAEPKEDSLGWFKDWYESTDGGSALAELDVVRVREAELVLEDRKLDAVWVAEGLDLTVVPGAETLNLSVPLVLSFDGHRVALDGSVEFQPSTEQLVTSLGFADLDPSTLVRFHPGFASMKALGDALDGSIEARFGPEFRFERAELEAGGGAARAHVELEQASDEGTMDAVLELEGLEPVALASASERLEPLARLGTSVDGRIEARLVGAAVHSTRFELEAGAGRLRLPELYSRPLPIETLQLAGATREGFDEIEVNRGRLQSAGVGIDFNGSMRRSEEVFDLEVDVGLDSLSVSQLVSLWPAAKVSAAREWIERSIPEGELAAIEVELAGRWGEPGRAGLAVESLAGSFEFSDLDLTVLEPQPAVSGVGGTATLGLGGMSFAVESGAHRGLAIENAHVAVDWGEAPVLLMLSLASSGTLADTRQLLSGEPLRATPEDLLEGATGRIQAEVDLEMPLSREAAGEVSLLRARAHVERLSWDYEPMSLEIREGALDLALDLDESLVVEGTATLSGSPVEVSVRHDLRGDDRQRQIRIRGYLDQRLTEQFDFELEPYLSGTAAYDLTVVTALACGAECPPVELRATADLKQSRLALPLFDWSKPTGSPGRARLAGALGANTLDVHSFELAAADLEISGALVVDTEARSLRRARIDRFELGGMEAKLSYEAGPSGARTLDLEGRNLDLTRSLDRLTEPRRQPADSSGDPLDLAFRIARAQFVEGSWIESISGTAQFDGARWSEAHLEVDTGPGDNAHLDYAPGENVQEFSLRVSGLGGVLAGLGLVDGLELGALEADGTVDPKSARLSGQLTAENFTLNSKALLTRILDLASLDGLRRTLEGEGLGFSSLKGDFEYSDGQLRLTSIKAHGSGLGITGEALFDLREDEIEARGLVASARAVAKVVGKIPVVNTILLGRTREGILATGFTIGGSFDDPEIAVQPFSVLTPGITRDILTLGEE
jgi:hypothetical protein